MSLVDLSKYNGVSLTPPAITDGPPYITVTDGTARPFLYVDEHGAVIFNEASLAILDARVRQLVREELAKTQHEETT